LNRRSAALLVTGLLGAAAGAGWRLFGPTADPQGAGASPGGPLAGADAGAVAQLWALRVPRPGGGELALGDFRGRPLLVNFWATWCPPCVKELPDLDRFHTAYAASGWQVVALAIDGPTAVRDFLARRPLGFPVGLAGLEGSTLARGLGNATGGLPFTVVLDAGGRITRRKLGATTYSELQSWASAS